MKHVRVHKLLNVVGPMVEGERSARLDELLGTQIVLGLLVVKEFIHLAAVHIERVPDVGIHGRNLQESVVRRFIGYKQSRRNQIGIVVDNVVFRPQATFFWCHFVFIRQSTLSPCLCQSFSTRSVVARY